VTNGSGPARTPMVMATKPQMTNGNVLADASSVELKADLYACKPKGQCYSDPVLETLLRALMAWLVEYNAS
jgi:hypothetical protein